LTIINQLAEGLTRKGGNMIEFFYQTLTKFGYTHPVHAPTTHIPVGMVIGAFLFALGAYLFRRSNLALTARHCIMLALIALFPTVLFGYIDWQHFYAGAWVFPIKMKIGLAVLLLILLVIAVSLGRKAEKVSTGVLLIYGLCLLNVTALGYFGGELVYGNKRPGKAVEAQKVQISGDLFNKTCKLCHPGGGNVFKANFPLTSAPQLANFDTFLVYIRNPKARDGSQIIMPAFPADKLSEQQAKEIYQYVVQVLKKQ
jgi:uncharacterized membrane protein